MGNALIFIAEVIRIPQKKTEKAAGFDLKSSVAFDVQPFDQITIGTGVRVSLPTGYYGQIVDKSSFSTRHSLFVAAGIIDEDYTGEIKVVLFNPTPKLRSIARDTVLAQMLVIPYYTGGAFNLEPTQAHGWHRHSARGPAGFGVNDTAALPNGISIQRG
jgi:dUTP pyrophosphatase